MSSMNCSPWDLWRTTASTYVPLHIALRWQLVPVLTMQYHDDGETELGPTVAALSLGSPSIMKFRPKYNKSGFGDTLPIGSRTGGGRAYKPVLEVPMKHGDMMVMHGAHIHRIYEVSSRPSGY